MHQISNDSALTGNVVFDLSGREVPVTSLFSTKPVLIVFLRHYG